MALQSVGCIYSYSDELEGEKKGEARRDEDVI